MASQFLARTLLIVISLQGFVQVTLANKTVVKAKDVVRVDTMEEFPSYDTVHKLEKQVLQLITDAWSIVKKELPVNGTANRTLLIEDVVWPKLMIKFFEAQIIRSLDLDIRFKRNPANFLDVLLGITTFDQMKQMSMDPLKDRFSFVKLRWIELSSLATQFMRFYNWKVRDIFNGGIEMMEIIEAFPAKRTYIWVPKERTPGEFHQIKINAIPEHLAKKMFLDDGNKDAFLGLRKLMDKDPDVLTKSKFDATACTKGHDHLHIEPSGLDVPYYLLFFLCLVDLKNYVITNIVNIYLAVFLKRAFTNQAALRTELHDRLAQKIELFDNAFKSALKNDGPAYLSYPGITMCNPPELADGIAYEKFTNFVKVFIAPEVDLHKSGTCRPTCDVLDVTYRPCDYNDTDCRMDREKECIQTPGRCDKFNPPCPTGHYHCHNSTEKITFCPSSRPDRLYEFAVGEDSDTKFHYGPMNQKCANETVEVEGGWKLEDDILVCTQFCLVTSEFKHNRVIVGVKFQRIKDQIHIAIADAVALPGKDVDNSTVKWHTPKYETDPKHIIRLNMDIRSLNIDDVVTDSLDRVVTGIRFYPSEYRGKFLYQYVGIETLTHQISKENGTLIQGTGRYRRNANSTMSRKLYNYQFPPNGPDDPVRGNCTALPDTRNNEYIVFRATSLDKDVAQSTIPYFDIQKLISPNPRWLKGIGILQKTCPGYGGFLAFKLIEHSYG